MLRDATGSRVGCLPTETGSSPVRSAKSLSVGRNGASKTPDEGSIPSRLAGGSYKGIILVLHTRDESSILSPSTLLVSVGTA